MCTIVFQWYKYFFANVATWLQSSHFYDVSMCVESAADHLREEYIKSRFYYEPDEWPPYHPKHYTTLALIHHKGSHTNAEVISVEQSMFAEGNISTCEPHNSSISHHGKKISDLFPNASASSYFILIEGAPGIGKTVLSKEIAYQWADKKLLKHKKFVFLLFLRDPNLKKVVTLENLIQHLFNINKIGSDLSEYLFKNKGKDLTIIFDGYDEMSEEDRSNSLVAKIIRRNTLPECDLVITSRPTASLHLRDMADCRVEVLGFTEEDRLDYIQQALKGSHEKVDVLQSYLKSNSTINALCYIPLNMTILLCLYEDINSVKSSILNVEKVQEIGLPNTQTEMYEKFILMAITRSIKKSNKIFSGNYHNISKLPIPYNEVFNELIQLAYYGITKDKIIFNSDEEILTVQQVCTSLNSRSSDGLGLLKVTEYVQKISFHFLHFSIQEYLAAYYIALLSAKRQLQLLKDTFWEIRYFNIWIMYVGITGGKKLAWKHYISDNRFMLSTVIFKSSRISKKFLIDKVKSLHLFQCFAEIGGKEFVGEIFVNRIIELNDQTLLPSDINTLCFFLLRSANKQWRKLDLSNCNIGDTGSDILCKSFLDKNRDTIYIDEVNLSGNLLQSHSILGLLEVVEFWHASRTFFINEDYDDYESLFKSCLNKFSLYTDEAFSQTVLIDPFLFAHNADQQPIYNQLVNATYLTGLYFNHFNNESIDSVFIKQKLNENLSKLHIIGRNFSIHFLGAVVQAIKKESDAIYIHDNTLSDEDVSYISSLILCKTSATNPGVWVVIGRTKILGNLNNVYTLNAKLSSTEIYNLAKSIRSLCSSSSVTNFSRFSYYEDRYIFEDLLNLLQKNVTKCEVTFYMIKNSILIANGVKFSDLSKILPLNNDLKSIYMKQCELNLETLAKLITQQKCIKVLHIFNFKSLLDIDFYCLKEICINLLNAAPELTELLIHSTSQRLSCILEADLFLIQRVLLATSDTLIGQNPTSGQLSLILHLEPNITVWKLPNCHFNFETFYQLAIMINNVSELDVSGCSIGECELQELNQSSEKGKCFTNLTKLNISNIKITIQAASNMADMLLHTTKLNDFDLHNNNNNNLLTACASKVFSNLSSLIRLDISFNRISNKTANDIAVLFSQNSELKEVDMKSCDLQATGTVRVFKAMKNLSNLTKLNISNNNISDEVSDDVAVALFQSNSLEELDLSHNCVHAAGAIKIFRKMNLILHLSKFNISHNGITDKAADDLADVLSHNFGLTELDLSYNCLQATGASIICKRMNGLTNLLKLNISNNNITGEAAHDIATILSQNKSLEALDLSYNNLATSGTVQIFSSMKSLRSLTKLNVGSIGMTDFAADDVTVVLNNITKLKELDLSHNNIQTAGATKIFKNITISNLNKLNISHNNITDEAAEDIAAFISRNTDLKELDLCHNNLQDAGATKICKANISGLIKFNISHNNITAKESYDTSYNMATFLSHNNKLQVLNLSCNNIRFISIFAHMRTFYDLSILKISNCCIISKAVNLFLKNFTAQY